MITLQAASQSVPPLSDGVAATLLSFLLTSFLLALIIIVVLYAYTSLTLMIIAKKTKTARPWMAWIPLANIFLTTNIAELPWWWALIIIISTSLISFTAVGLLSIVVNLIFTGRAWWRIAGKRNYQEWVGILMLIPFVNLIVMGLLAWNDME